MDKNTMKTLLQISRIGNIILMIIISLILLISLVGIILIPIVIGIIWYINNKIKTATEYLEEGQYKKVKDTLLLPSIIELILVSRIIGILMLLVVIFAPKEEEIEQT